MDVVRGAERGKMLMKRDAPAPRPSASVPSRSRMFGAARPTPTRTVSPRKLSQPATPRSHPNDHDSKKMGFNYLASFNLSIFVDFCAHIPGEGCSSHHTQVLPSS